MHDTDTSTTQASSVTQSPDPAGRIRLLYIVSPSTAFAGIERVVHTIANELAMHFISSLEVHVLYCSRYDIVESDSTRYRYIFADVGRLRSMYVYLNRFFRTNHFDVIVVPQIEAATLMWLAKPARTTKLVVWLHGNPFVERQRPLSRLLFTLFERLASRHFAAGFIVAPSQARYFDRAPALRDRIAWVPNPIRSMAKTIAEAVATPRTNSVNYVALGRLTYQKGFDILIRAFAKVVEHDGNAHLSIVGYGEQRAALLGLIAALRLKDRVDIIEMRLDPGPALIAADVFVSSSRWEGWSLAICEALACGLPVIAADCDFGPRDILTDPRLGVLVPPNDVDALAQAMINSDDLSRTSESAEYRKTYAARFDSQHAVKQHYRALSKCLGLPIPHV